jgi:hypothetical protein
MLVEHRIEIIQSYNERMRAGGERKQVILSLRREWRERLGTRGYPFSEPTFYRWARSLKCQVSSSKLTQDDRR